MKFIIDIIIFIQKNELMEEIIRLKPEFKIKNFGYEKGNYYIILVK
jgi:hypothetical protein